MGKEKIMSDKKTKKFEDRIVPTFLVYELATMANGFAGEDGKMVQYDKIDYFLITDNLDGVIDKEGEALQLTGHKAGEKVKYKISSTPIAHLNSVKMEIDSVERFTGDVTYIATGLARGDGKRLFGGIVPAESRFENKYVKVIDIMDRALELSDEQCDKARAKYCNDKLREEAECDVAELMADKN